MANIKNFKFLILFVYLFSLLTVINIACDGGGGDSGDNGSDSTPSPDFNQPLGKGAIQGSVTSSNGSPLNAIHVRTVNIDDTNIQISAFSGIGPNLTFREGVFRIDGVPAGNYRVLIEKLDGRSLVFQDSRYSEFVSDNSPLISFPDEYFNGDGESPSDNPQDFVIVTVVDGQTTQGINFITND